VHRVVDHGHALLGHGRERRTWHLGAWLKSRLSKSAVNFASLRKRDQMASNTVLPAM
jgi:hypothetical protein